MGGASLEVLKPSARRGKPGERGPAADGLVPAGKKLQTTASPASGGTAADGLVPAGKKLQ